MVENTEKPTDNVVHLRDFRDKEKTDDEFREALIFQCFIDEMKLSLHEQMNTHCQKLPKSLDSNFPEDPDEAEELARVLAAQARLSLAPPPPPPPAPPREAEGLAGVLAAHALVSLAANYASWIDQEYESIFSGVGTAKDLFLNFYEQDMEDQYNE